MGFPGAGKPSRVDHNSQIKAAPEKNRAPPVVHVMFTKCSQFIHRFSTSGRRLSDSLFREAINNVVYMLWED